MKSYSPANSLTITAEYLKRNPLYWPPHVVILGAGASIQAFPNGDINGKLLPSMDNLIDIIGLKDELEEIGFSNINVNFETIYGRLYDNMERRDFLNKVELKIYNYFSMMQLPQHPTLYDHLILSLRHHDLIATFNWDPFLFDAWERLSNRVGIEKLPQLAFLHGNVRLGYCLKHKVFGRNGRICPDCDLELKPAPILYPIENKDYERNTIIMDAWEKLKFCLRKALSITIFGYSAPVSDQAALEVMKIAWNGLRDREIETINIIDIKDGKTIRKTWDSFIYSHHYKIEKDFYSSAIPRHARRNTEALIARTLEGRFVEECPIPKNADWEHLFNRFYDLVKLEQQA